jgi:uncharacterized membrane protein YdjX (TVP38/TMEM64 family)
MLAKHGRLALTVAVLLLLVIGLLSAGVSPSGGAVFLQDMVEFLRNAGAFGIALFAAMQILLVVSGAVPGSLLGIGAGALYGLVPGFVLAASGSLLGAVIAFGLSRSLFRSSIERLLARHGRLHSLDLSVSQDGWKLACLLRLSPIMPFSATSYLLGLSSISLPHYVMGTLASMPALFGYVSIGTLTDAGLSAWAGGDNPLRWVLLGAGGIATLLLVAYLGRLVVRRDLVGDLVASQGVH